MKAVLISTYELGRQPFGLASPAAWLKRAGVSVTCLDLSIQRFTDESVVNVDLVAFYVPMHTATRITMNLVGRIKDINPNAHLCFYGLYASINESLFRKLGADTILGGEFEEGLVNLVENLSSGTINQQSNNRQQSVISLSKQKFIVPDRSTLPDLHKYAYLNVGTEDQRVVGYVEATRGCKHMCRHCPIVPVYEGKFRVVQKEVVLEDIRQQVEVGAEHITFGDPDFFNGPGHAIAIVQTLHQEFPDLTYDVTIKVEHLLKHSQHLQTLKNTGCLFVTSAIESIDNYVLEMFDKGHTREEFIQVVSQFSKIGLTLNPTFVTFTPWIHLKDYLELLNLILELDLVEHVSPIQYAIRLLIPSGSKLLELPFIHELVGEFDEKTLAYPWSHPDPRVDELHQEILNIVKESQSNLESRNMIFDRIWKLAYEFAAVNPSDFSGMNIALSKGSIPHLSEAWYC